MPLSDANYLVWTDYGYEGWKPREASTWEEATVIREEQLGYSSSTVLITRVCQLRTIRKRDPRHVHPPRGATKGV